MRRTWTNEFSLCLAPAGDGGAAVVDDPAAAATADKVVLDKAAADTAASEKATADQAAADKVAADAAAQAAADAGKTPEQIAAATKATADAETAAKAAAEAAKPPEKYDLTLPTKSLLDVTDVAQMGLEAKALGLTNAQAQALLDARSTAITQQADAYLADLKADKVLGGDRYNATVQHATKGRDWLFKPTDPTTPDVLAWFNKTGFGNHKALVGAFARIGRALAEDTVVAGAAGAGATDRKPTAEVLFGSSAQDKA